MTRASELLLLDTHAWLWSLEHEAGAMATSVFERIERASKAGRILVSAITVWELALLQARGRLMLRTAFGEWIDRGLSAPGTRLAGLSPKILIESTRLPGELHRDPADRMLIATARQMDARLVTRDRAILQYAESGHVGVVDANP